MRPGVTLDANASSTTLAKNDENHLEATAAGLLDGREHPQSHLSAGDWFLALWNDNDMLKCNVISSFAHVF